MPISSASLESEAISAWALVSWICKEWNTQQATEKTTIDFGSLRKSLKATYHLEWLLSTKTPKNDTTRDKRSYTCCYMIEVLSNISEHLCWYKWFWVWFKLLKNSMCLLIYFSFIPYSICIIIYLFECVYTR